MTRGVKNKLFLMMYIISRFGLPNAFRTPIMDKTYGSNLKGGLNLDEIYLNNEGSNLN